MSHRPELTIDGSGARPLVTKTAASPAARSRLEHELAVLRVAQHPGVVTLIDVHDDHTGLRVRTVFCGSRTLADVGSLPTARVAGVVAALATTVADLHDLGIAHGRLAPDHVLIASDGRPVLCGLGDASVGDAAATRRCDDVHALGCLLQGLLDQHDDLVPIPPSRLSRRGAWSGYQRRALLNLADQATAEDPLLRPTARQLAQNLRATVPDATLVEHGTGLPAGTATADGMRGSRDQARRMVPLAGCAAAAVLLAWAASGLLASAEQPPRTQPAEPPTLDIVAPPPSGSGALGATTTTSSSSTTTSEPPPGPSAMRHQALGCATASDHSVAALSDGRPCPVTLRYGDGVLTLGDEHFGLGLPDAAVAVGDFSCDGAPQAAVLDRSTGDLFVFEAWADERPVATPAIDDVEGGKRLLAEPTEARRCHRLVTIDQYGIRHVATLEVRS
jgi:hypothetical protein